MKKRARELVIEMGRTELKCSNGWWQKFKRRRIVKRGKISGESEDFDLQKIGFSKIRPSLFSSYDAKEIFNCDETSFFYEQLPAKTNHLPGSKDYGKKISKEHTISLFCCSRAGKKLFPFPMERSTTPR